ncbi:DUF1176 domain-containing protein [Leptospira adleri]|uniref:DUF1176 domain-containing protein n=1 Tax=Leptospira adleri TaxID=2023186 RepID=UPI001083A889|nr:DUF1176 domain-containing protein [Leptospira adleri]TGM57943.1 DUF1176 domain-containing protein [Leptospira adleri]
MKYKRFLFLLLFVVCAIWFFKNRGFAEKEEGIPIHEKRVRISWPEDCGFADNSAPSEKSLEGACAIAMESLSEKLPKDCEYDNFTLGESGRVDFYKYFQFHQIPIRFYLLSNGTFLGELLCKTGAYNQSFVYFIYDERSLPVKTKILSFESYDVDTSAEETRFKRIESQSLIRFYKKESGELIAFWKHRGMGDCGRFFRYKLSERNETQLIEFRAKLECDGKLAYSAEEIPRLWTLYAPIPKSRLERIREEIVSWIDNF